MNVIFGYPVQEEQESNIFARLYTIVYQNKTALLGVFHKDVVALPDFAQRLQQAQADHEKAKAIAQEVYVWTSKYVIMEYLPKVLDFSRVPQPKKLFRTLCSVWNKLHTMGIAHGGLRADLLHLREDGGLCVGGIGFRHISFMEQDRSRYSFPKNRFYIPQAADIFALALFGYQLLSGSLPWETKCTSRHC